MRAWYRRIARSQFTRLGMSIFVILLGIIPSSGIVSASPPPPVTLPGHVLKNLSSMQRLSAVPPGQHIALTIALRPTSSSLAQDAVARAALVRQGKASWLSPGDIGRLYGQPQAAIDALVAYFIGFGLTASPPAADHLSFKVSGTAAQIEQALGVTLDNYQDNKSHRFYATSKDPRLPANLAGTVQAIFGLDDYPALRRLSVQAAGSPGYYTPLDMQTAYNVLPLYGQGYTGTGMTIGIIGCDQFLTSDLQTFEDQFGLPHAPIASIPVAQGSPGNSPEATLDLEWSSAIAEGASLRYYQFPGSGTGCSLPGLYDAINAATTENTASVLNISLGACESGLGSSTVQAFESELAAAEMQGQTVLVASGDSGAYECTDAYGNPVLGVSYPASSAYVTAVGGTALLINSDSSYGSETAWGSWSECATPPACGSGGGVSSSVPKPSWQSQVNAGSWRMVPDVALNSDPDTGNVIYFSGDGLGWRGGVGGTSIAAPQWAGIVAMATQAAGHRLGLINPLLYGPVAASEAVCSVYHDITSGNNLYYSATPGYDLATGWGSPNAARLLPILTSAATSTTPTTSTVAGQYLVFLPVVFRNACGS